VVYPVVVKYVGVRGAVEILEMITVEAGKAFLCGDPDVTALVFDQIRNFIGRKSRINVIRWHLCVNGLRLQGRTICKK
jgi:hypothetical protein